MPHLHAPELKSQLEPSVQTPGFELQGAVAPQAPPTQNCAPVHAAPEPHLQSPVALSQVPMLVQALGLKLQLAWHVLPTQI